MYRYIFALLLAALVMRNASAADIGYVIQTVAGSDFAGDGGPARGAFLAHAEGIAVDLRGNLYIADTDGHRIRRVDASGMIQTVAGTGKPGYSGDGGPATAAQLNLPYGITVDVRGNLFVADLGNARVRKITPDGNIMTVAGGGKLAPGGDGEGSPAVEVRMSAPRNIAVDALGTLYISDFDAQCVYRVTPDGTLTTFTGTGKAGTSGENVPALSAALAWPTALALDASGALYIADSQNHRVRRIYNGLITTVAIAMTPTGLTIDSAGNLLIADSAGCQVIRRTPAGALSAVSLAARDIAVDPGGGFYIVWGNLVSKVGPTGTVSLAAGGGSSAFGDGGLANQARLRKPSGLARDLAGSLYIADTKNHRIRKAAVSGIITTVAGTGESGYSGDGGAAVSARLNAPGGVAVDPSGALYIADTSNHCIRKVTLDGIIQTVAGTLAELDSPAAVFVGPGGTLYIADSGNHRVRKVTTDGRISTVVTGSGAIGGLVLDRQGNLYFTEPDLGRVSRLSAGGEPARILSDPAPIWTTPRGLAVDDAGSLYVADAGAQEVIRVDANGRASVLAGNGTAGFSGDGGPAVAASLDAPAALALDPDGSVYVADSSNDRVRKLSPALDSVVFEPVAAISVVNAASLAAGPVAPGEIISILGLAGIVKADVRIDGVSSAWTEVRGDRVNTQIPYTANAGSGVMVEVFSQGSLRARVALSTVEAAPGLFAQADGTGQAAALNEDSTLNSVDNPAARGSIVVFYGTGEGKARPDGSPLLPVSLRVGPYEAQVLFAESLPGSPGLFQVNARMPSGYVPAGVLPVVLQVGATTSQAGVIVALK